jgi:hypothetical protein
VTVVACALPVAAILTASTSSHTLPGSPTDRAQLLAPSHPTAETSVLAASPRACTRRVPASELNQAVASAGPHDVICLSQPTSSSVEASPGPSSGLPLQTGTPSPVPTVPTPTELPATPTPTTTPDTPLPDRTSEPLDSN